MGNAVLSCGQFTVRSRKALDRIASAESNNLTINRACYRFIGFDSPELMLNGNPVTLHTVEDVEQAYATEANCEALFFDQTPYMFSVKLPEETEVAQLFSPIASWCDSADWDPESKKLSVPVNFGNDLGDFELCWEYETIGGERHSASFSGQVFSTKLDIYEHFGIMLDEVKERFEWIQLDLLRQTTWGWSHDSDSESSLKTWLLIFQQVRDSMEERFRKLIEQHRKRLVPETQMLRAEQMRRIAPKLEERVFEGIRENPNRHYPVVKKVLDADTPENRYMKHILFHTVTQLNEVIDKIMPVTRISAVFKERLREWEESWSILKQNRFWRGIGAFHGLLSESLILSQDPLYTGIRRSWYLLQQGLKFLDQELRGGIQNAAQLYEVWCLVKIDQLITDVGWQCINGSTVDFERGWDDFDSDNEELRSGTVKFSYRKEGLDNTELSLLFQPTAGAKPEKSGVWDGMVAIPVTQKPDIVLRLHRYDLPKEPVYTWIFDAKYRLNGNNAPDDAVNQMHRYRDAILWAGETSGKGRLTRESIGAYILYPGKEHDVSLQSPQIASIDKTNIGAFPLRPIRVEQEPQPTLLKNRLHAFLEIKMDYSSIQETQGNYFAAVPTVKQNPTDIFAKCITKSSEKMNTMNYWENCRLYRLPDRAVKKGNLYPEKWTYLIPASRDGEQLGNFPILSVKKMTRSEIKKQYDAQQIKMHSKSKAGDDIYWLFTLGEPLEQMPHFDDIENRQGFVIKA
jgi:predicted component of viral defense system (DUF524 family)